MTQSTNQTDPRAQAWSGQKQVGERNEGWDLQRIFQEVVMEEKQTGQKYTFDRVKTMGVIWIEKTRRKKKKQVKGKMITRAQL